MYWGCRLYYAYNSNRYKIGKGFGIFQCFICINIYYKNSFKPFSLQWHIQILTVFNFDKDHN